MPLTRSFKELVERRAASDPDFAAALDRERCDAAIAGEEGCQIVVMTLSVNAQVAAVHEASHGYVHIMLAREFGMNPAVSLRRLVLRSDGSGIVPAGNGFIDADKYETEEMRRVAQTGNVKTNVNVLPAVIARVVEGVAGSIGEARYTNQSFMPILTRGSGAEDWNEIQRWLGVFGIQDKDRYFEQAVRHADTLFGKPRAWEAVLSLADVLLAKNEISGAEAVEVVDRAMNKLTTVTSL